MRLTRRNLLALASAAAAESLAATRTILPARADDAEPKSYGLSTFGELGMPPDFKHLRYVNPDAPKGGLLSIQIRETIGNQNFDTFDTFNIFVFKGNGAAGMDATFDTLMAGTGDEPNSMYGLVAQSVRTSADKLTYRFKLRPEARFRDGSKLTAADVAFSLNILKTKGHPLFQTLLDKMASAEAEADDIATVKFTPDRSRDIHLFIASLPIFSAAYWKDRDFEASTLEPPLGSGAYKVGNFEQGRFVAYTRVADYWAANLPIMVGLNNFDTVRYEYYRERQVAFEAFKAGQINFNQEYTSRIWANGYDFPAVNDGRVKKEELADGAPTATQGWYFNTRREIFADPRVREAIGYAFDFEWTNKNIMYSLYKRVTSFFENSDMKAVGKPSPEELVLLEPFRGQVPDEVFGEPFVPPVSDGSGSESQPVAARRHAAAIGRVQGRRQCLEIAERQAAAIRIPRFLDGARAAYAAFRGQSHQARHPDANPLGRFGAISEQAQQFRFRRDRRRAERLLDPRRRPAQRLQLESRANHGLAEHGGHRRQGGRRAGRPHRNGKNARGIDDRLPRARPGAASRPLLGFDVVQQPRADRLLGRVSAADDDAQIRDRGAGHLVVGRRQGQEDRLPGMMTTMPTGSGAA